MLPPAEADDAMRKKGSLALGDTDLQSAVCTAFKLGQRAFD